MDNTIKEDVESARAAQQRCYKKLDEDIEDARGVVKKANFASEQREIKALEHLLDLLKAKDYIRRNLNET